MRSALNAFRTFVARLVTPCCPGSAWCVLDRALACKSDYICDHHDAVILGER